MNPFRKNYAGIGFTYDGNRDAFIAPQPFASWSLNEDSCLWEDPIPIPVDGQFYLWDEDTLSWIVKDMDFFKLLISTTIINNFKP